MRLLHVHRLDFAEFANDCTPKYVAASHRWSIGSETSFKAGSKRRNTDSLGYRKVEAFAGYIRNNVPSVE